MHAGKTGRDQTNESAPVHNSGRSRKRHGGEADSCTKRQLVSLDERDDAPSSSSPHANQRQSGTIVLSEQKQVFKMTLCHRNTDSLTMQRRSRRSDATTLAAAWCCSASLRCRKSEQDRQFFTPRAQKIVWQWQSDT